MRKWRHRYAKYVDSLSKREHKDGIFEFFHPEARFKKSTFIGTVVTESIWRIGQNDTKHVRLYKVFPCGWPLRMDMSTNLI